MISGHLSAALSLPDHSFPCSSFSSSIGNERDIDSVQTDEHRDENFCELHESYEVGWTAIKKLGPSPSCMKIYRRFKQINICFSQDMQTKAEIQ